MASAEEWLQALPALGVPELLERLAALRERAARHPEVQVPLATFHLRSGRDVTGWLLGRSDPSGRGSGLLIRLAGRERHPPLEVLYVDAASVEAVTLLDVPGSAYLLSDGKVPPPEPPGAAPPPSRLTIKRRAEALSQTLSAALDGALRLEVLWDGVPDSGGALRSLAALLEELSEEAGALAQDPMGKEALRVIRVLQVAQAGEAAVTRAGEVVTLAADLNAGTLGRLERAGLRAALERVL